MRIRPRTRLAKAALMAALSILCVSGMLVLSEKAALAQDDWFSESTLRDGILGREELTEAQRQALDLNDDGQVDVADLVTFLKGFGATPKVSFEATTSEATEGTGAATVTLYLSRAFSGTVNYSIGNASTAASGTDYTAPSGTVSVDGTTATISVPLVDDLEREAMETIELILEDGTGYVVDSPSSHTIYIQENDTLWQGMMALGDSNLGFQLDIRMDGATTEATLFGAEGGIIPLTDPAEDGWPVQAIAFDQGAFDLTAEDVAVAGSEATRFGCTFTRTFVFHAETSASEGIDPNTIYEIPGEVTVHLVPDSQEFQHLQRERTGTFALSRTPMRSDVPEPSLEEVQ